MGEHSKPLHRWLSFFMRAPKWRTLTALSAVVLALLVYVGFAVYTDVKYGRLEADLKAAESLWKSQQISSYRFVIYAAGEYGPSKVRVSVENGKVASTEYIDAVYDKGVSVYFAGRDTVPSLFDMIRNELRNRDVGWNPDIAIGYSTDFGYPLYVDHWRKLNLGVKGYYDYSISDFKALAPTQVAD